VHDLKVWSALQIVCDLASTTNGKIMGPKREKGSSQFVKVFLVNPDLIYADKHPEPRFGPAAWRIMLTSIFKEQYGYDIEVKQFGKPSSETFDYAIEMVTQ
jgi:ribonucleotide monophosphatase NagD (HAD superfamily)